MRILLALFILLLSAHQLSAQAIRVQEPGKHEFGVGLGMASYHGDVQAAYQLNSSNFAGQAFYRYNLSKAVNLRTNLSIQSISGDMSQLMDRFKSTNFNYSFQKTLYEAGFMLEYNFFDFRYEKIRRYSPYLVMGLGALYFDNSNPEGASVPPIQPVLPFGLGYKRSLTRDNTWSIGLEFLTRKTFTDYLDGVSERNPQNQLQWGEPDRMDWYGTLTLSVSYTFFQVNCATDFVY